MKKKKKKFARRELFKARDMEYFSKLQNKKNKKIKKKYIINAN